MRKEYDLLLIGATALAAGVALAHPELRIAVLEEGFGIAGEFCHTWQTSIAATYTFSRVTLPRRPEGRTRSTMMSTAKTMASENCVEM